MILFAINNPKPVPEYDFEANIEKPNQKPIIQFKLYDPTTIEGSKHITYFITIKKDGKKYHLLICINIVSISSSIIVDIIPYFWAYNKFLKYRFLVVIQGIISQLAYYHMIRTSERSHFYSKICIVA